MPKRKLLFETRRKIGSFSRRTWRLSSPSPGGAAALPRRHRPGRRRRAPVAASPTMWRLGRGFGELGQRASGGAAQRAQSAGMTAPRRAATPRAACAAMRAAATRGGVLRVKIVAAAVPCDNATDTGCVVAASTVAKAKAEDAAHLSDAKANIDGDRRRPPHAHPRARRRCAALGHQRAAARHAAEVVRAVPGAQADRQPLRPEQGRGGGGGRLLPG